MRVLYILSAYPSYSETFIHNEINTLLGQGHQLGVLNLRMTKHSPKTDLCYLRNTYNPFKLIYSIFKEGSLGTDFVLKAFRRISEFPKYMYLFLSKAYLIRQVKSYKPDLILTHFLFSATAVAFSLSQKLSIPMHLRLHTTYSSLPSSEVANILSNAKSISAISQSLIGHLQTKFDVNREIACIRQDVNLEELHRIAQDNRTKTENQLIAVGRLVPKKGFMELINAFSELEDQYTLCIYGDGPLKRQLQRRIDELQANKRILLKQSISHRDLLVEIKSSAALIVPSKVVNGDEDGIPTVIVEAMVLGTVVFSSEVGAISELAWHQQTAYILDCSSIETLFESMEDALKDRENWNSVLSQAKEKVKYEYSKKLTLNG